MRKAEPSRTLSRRLKREDSRTRKLIEEAEIEPKMIKHLEIRKNLQSGAIETTVKILVKRISRIDRRERKDLVRTSQLEIMSYQEEMSHQEKMRHREEMRRREEMNLLKETNTQEEMNTKEEMIFQEEKKMITKEEMMRVFKNLGIKRGTERMSESEIVADGQDLETGTDLVEKSQRKKSKKTAATLQTLNQESSCAT